MRLALATLLVVVLGLAPGIAKYAGPPPPDPALKMAARPAENREATLFRAGAPWAAAKRKPASLAALLAKFHRL